MTETWDRADLHKHLEFIQNIIARLANNGFLVKGWSLTVAGAFYGFAIQLKEWRLAAIGVLAVAIFWWLDGYFLRAEKMFRCLYKSVAEHPAEHPHFDLNHISFGARVGSVFRVMITETLRVFHGGLALIGVVASLISRSL